MPVEGALIPLPNRPNPPTPVTPMPCFDQQWMPLAKSLQRMYTYKPEAVRFNAVEDEASTKKPAFNGSPFAISENSFLVPVHFSQIGTSHRKATLKALSLVAS
jgi:hypothetical protein